MAGLLACCIWTDRAGSDAGVVAGIGGDHKPAGAYEAKVAWDEGTAAVDYGPGPGAGRLRPGIVMADMLHIDGRLLMAATDGQKIDILEVSDRLRALTGSATERDGQILALRWWRPSPQRPLYLSVVAWLDQNVSATIFSLENDRLVPVVKGLDTILGAFDTDGDGLPETLLSQEFDPEAFFGRRIKELYWDGDKLADRSPAFDLAPRFTVIGGQLADMTGDGKPEAIHVHSGILWISAGKQEIYTSAKQMGGSLSVLTYKKNPKMKDYITTSVFFEVAPVAADIDGDGRPEILAVASDQLPIKAPGLATTIDNSRLMVFKYQDGAFIKGTLGKPVAAALQGLAFAKGRVWYVTSETGSLLRPGGPSRLHALSLRE
ncbi:MAG: VCBS repeat-containing protein [Desulfobacteraceae bacterium]|nr:MAG: VCBS repeat-containing protein [Desulfobacteraceae bacterium]